MHYENQILDAIEQIVDSKIVNAGYDKTIQATIVNCEDATIGKYKVSYQNSVFYAYANSSEISYANGADVYILIPNGDMSRDKTILGSTQKLGKDYATAAIGEDAFEIVGTNCIDSHASFELCSYETTLAQVIYDRNSDNNPLNLNVKNLEEYIKESTSITLAATIRTELPLEQQFRGNYGIVYQIVFDDNATGEEVTRNYILDINQFEGSPYNYPNWKRQFGIFEADGKNFKYVNKVYLFCYDFPNQEVGERTDIFIKNLELYGTVALTESDLQSFKMSFITTQGTFFDENDGDKATRLIEAKVRVKGKYIDPNSQKLPYYWFVENNGVTSLSEDYCSYGGQGWKCLNKKNIIKGGDAETAPTVEWVPGDYKYTIIKENNQAKETRYKCVAVYNEVLISREIVITNYDSQWIITINSDNGTEFYYDIGNPSLKCLVNGNEQISNDYIYQWAEVDSKGNFFSLPNTTAENVEYETAAAGYAQLKASIAAEQAMAAASQYQLNEYLNIIKSYDKIRRVDKNKVIHLQVNTITNFTTYKCSVYHSGIYIGTASIVLTNRLDKKDLYTLVINNGVQTFKYNESGVAPTSPALENPQSIPALSFSIYDNLGEELSEDIISNCAIEWSVPINNTLIEISDTYQGTERDGYFVISDVLEINYSIAQKYNVSKTNNNIQLLVKYKDMNLVTRTDLTFAKEGEPGTNGTEFLCKIIPNINQTVSEYPMILNGNLNYTPINSNRWFRAQLWHSGEQIYDAYSNGITTENKAITLKWEVLKNKYTASVSDVSSISVTEDGQFSYVGYQAEFNSPADIVKCTLTYDDIDYYCTMPIITAVAETGYNISLVENTGFRYAVYATDGRKPQFDNTIPFTLKVTNQIDGYTEDISELTEDEGVTYNWTIKGALYNKDTHTFDNHLNLGLYNRGDYELKRNQGSYKPLDEYDGECLTNALECFVYRNNDTATSHNIVARINIPVHMLLNKYGHAELNDWDGNHVSIDENGSGVILAPQVGAGQKEQDNSFTGLLMGKVKEAQHTKQYIGLHGYNHGVRTIFLNSENGSALFGKTGTGQIIIDPVQDASTGKVPKGLIYSYNFWKDYGEDGLPTSYDISNEAGRDGEDQDQPTGMLIDLSTPEIRFGNGNFKVDSTGYITAKGGGHIAGWKIDNYKIHSDDERTVGRTGMNSVYTVDETGSLTEPVYVPNSNDPVRKAIAFWAGGSVNIGQGYEKFMVSHDGYVKMEAASIGEKYSTPIYIGRDGTDTYSAIFSGKKSQLTGLAQNGFYVGTNGIGLGYIQANGTYYSKFQVSNTGDVYTPSLTIRRDYDGEIGTLGAYTGSTGDISTIVIGVVTSKKSVVLEATAATGSADVYKGAGHIRLTSKSRNVYLEAQNGDVYFKTSAHKDKWYSIGTAFFS